MSKVKSWMRLLKIDPIPLIMDRAPVYIKYRTALEFFSEDSALIEELSEKLENDKARRKILESQTDNGTWKLKENYSLEEQQRAMQFLLQLKMLAQLYDLGCNKEMGPVQKAIIALLKMQKPDGKFPLHYHHHGLALLLLVKYGLGGNPFVDKGFRWIAKRQRVDGGWLSPATMKSGKSFKSSRSDIWASIVILQAFSSHSRLKRSETAMRAAEFILDSYLQKNETNLFPEAEAWNYLYTDYTDTGLFRGGTLRFIEALAPLYDFHEHPKFKKAVNWMLDQQMKDGLFPAVAGLSTKGDFNVTLRFLICLKEMDSAEKRTNVETKEEKNE